MEALTTWLASVRDRRRAPGVFDCCTMPADWIIAAGNADPMAAWRGAYSNEDEGLTIIERAGGLVALFDSALGAIGIARRAEGVKCGDIGVVRIAGQEAGAVFSGGRWIFVGKIGIGMASIDPAAIVAKWAVSHG